MKTRYVLDDSGYLVDRRGEVLGRVVGITIEDSPLPTTVRLGNGEPLVLDAKTKEETASPSPQTPVQLEREAAERCWNYWLSVSGKRQNYDSKRERIIRNALKLLRAKDDKDWSSAEQLVQRALLGLTRSPHHRGENEQRKTYLEIRYALRGIGDESDEERIEKAIVWASIHDPDAGIVDSAKVSRWLDEVRYTLSQSHRPERERGRTAYLKLRDAGFTVIQLTASPWARIER